MDKICTTFWFHQHQENSDPPSLRINCHRTLPHFSKGGGLREKKNQSDSKEKLFFEDFTVAIQESKYSVRRFSFFPTSWNKNINKILIAFISIFKHDLTFFSCGWVTYVRKIYIFLKERLNPGEQRVCQGTIMSCGGRGRRRGREGRFVPSKAGGCSISSIRAPSVSPLQPNPEETRSQRFRSISL